MQRSTSKSTSILRDVVDAVESLGEREVQLLLRNAVARNRIGNRVVSGNEKKSGTPVRPRLELIRSMANGLQTVMSREEAKRQIEMSEFSRRELEVLARSIDVPVRKDMKVNDIEDLIVNMTVGGRLNSQAIRGVG